MFTSFFRSLRHQTLNSIILISGLIIGLAAFILVYLFVTMEFSYDRFHQNFENIYRLEQDFGGQGRLLAITHRPAGPALKEKYPQVLDDCRLQKLDGEVVLATDTQLEFAERDGWYADPGFLAIFTFPLIEGNPETALAAPGSLVLTRSLARKLFPDDDAMGKTVYMGKDLALTVTAIARDCPVNTHLKFNFLVSLSTLGQLNGAGYLENWERFDLYTYLLLAPGTDVRQLQEDFRPLLRERIHPDYPSFLTLAPLSALHFRSGILLDPGPLGNLQKTWLYLSIGLFILVLACINFVNLSTARAGRRAREIGIRKTSGAGRMELVIHFLGESLVLVLFSFILALALVNWVLPMYNRMIDRELNLDILLDPWLLAALTGLVLVIGFLAGIYPALFLSRLEPVRAIRMQSMEGPQKGWLRKILVTFQFVIAALLISGTLVLVKQANYLRSKDLGYDRQHVLVLGQGIEGTENLTRFSSLTHEIGDLPGVESITISRFIPNGTYGTVPVWFEGAAEGELANINNNYIDEHFLETYRINLILGQNFLPDQPVDSIPPCIINEAAAKRFRWDTILGKRVEFGRVIGMVSDFNYYYPGAEIAPMVMYPIRLQMNNPGVRNFNCSIRTSPGMEKQVMGEVKNLYGKMYPDQEPNLRYFEDDFQGMFYRDKKQTRTILFFSGLAVFIACLGLFGLSAFLAQHRAREMAIRKVLGAGGMRVMSKYLEGFLFWVILANILALPASLWIMHIWLRNFSYHTGIPAWIYFLTLVVTLCIATFTLWYHSWKVSRQNPARTLSME